MDLPRPDPGPFFRVCAFLGASPVALDFAVGCPAAANGTVLVLRAFRVLE